MKEIDLTSIDEERREALVRRNPVQYYILCEQLGVEPELPELYEQGAIEIDRRRSIFQKDNDRLREIASAEDARGRYGEFIGEAERIGIMTPIFEDSRRKASLLEKYFPLQFGVDGMQPINSYNSAAIGRVYRKVMSQARENVRRIK